MMPQHPNDSIWSQITSGEIVLLVAGGLLTVAIIIMFIWLAVRASREERARADGETGAARDGAAADADHAAARDRAE